MLLSILFVIFAVLLLYTAYFFLTMKAQVFLYYKSSDASEKTKPIFMGFGIGFLLCGLFSLYLAFFYTIIQAFVFLGIVMVLILSFLIYLNKSM
ncbi:hypothetical protein SAMN04488506_0563 [Desemzia incerta]|uniref:DUF3784 domain-containing protein n=1 Tax=Desemzia incerta TaxID=82801 RepID=A0A1I5VT01_9LACT|nr:hypothetical protein [Desemzia incerta]SFQ10407.1 hypothetical protein SAMN04488506_0563 [Desemzia incerta]